MRCTRPCHSFLRTASSVGSGSACASRGDAIRQAGVARDRHAAAVGVERLQRLEAEERRVADRADLASLVRRAERVRAVLDRPPGLCARATSMMPSMSHGSPHKCVGTTATVFGPTTRASVSGVIANVSGSTSAKTGVKPATRAISGMTQKVSAGSTTSAAGSEVERLQDVVEGHAAVRRRRPRGRRRAASQTSISNSRTCGPSMNWPALRRR